MVAMFRSCAEALKFSAIATAGAPARTAAWSAVSLILASAPMRTVPSGATSIAASGNAPMSTSVAGFATSILMRSTMLVPPARNAEPAF